MTALKVWWKALNGTKQAIIAIIFFLTLGAGGGTVWVEYRNVPERVEALEVKHVETTEQLEGVDRKLDEALCILTQSNDENPLDCIEKR